MVWIAGAGIMADPSEFGHQGGEAAKEQGKLPLWWDEQPMAWCSVQPYTRVYCFRVAQ